MDALKIKKLIESVEDKSSVYLIEQLADTAGFFTNSGKLLYVAKDIHDYPYEGIETDYLKLKTHIRISSVKNNQSFQNDYYNIIIFKGSLDDSNISSFLHLCSIHAKNESELNFKEFFYSLITLFQLSVEQAFKNAVGLYGELKFMQYVREQMKVDISDCWHRNGTYSKYDFSNGKSNIEIKTTLADNSEVKIKHNQIFGEHSCFLAVVNCEKYENGETIEELISELYAYSDAFNGINFSINLEKELKRVSVNDIKNVRFGMKSIQLFSVEDINPFPVIPHMISKLNYFLDVSELQPASPSEFETIIRGFWNK